MAGSSLLVSCLLLATTTAIAVSDPSFDYLYIESNEGGSSGGHTAIRFGRDVFHFQNENGLLILKRDRAKQFLFAYALLGNRTIHSTRIAVSQETLSTLVGDFKRRHRAQEAQIRVGEELRDDRNLLERLREVDEDPANRSEHRNLAIPGLGYFAAAGGPMEDPRPDLAQPNHSTELRSLRQAIDRIHGSDFRSKRRLASIAELQALRAEDPTDWAIEPPTSTYAHPPFTRSYSRRLLDLTAGLAALDILEDARPLAERARHAPTDELFALTAEEVRALGRYSEELADQLVQLVDSRRTDWGQTLLVGMARLSALGQSVASRHLVFLDTFPEDANFLDRGELDRLGEFGAKMLTENRKQLDASRSYFRENADAGELAWERVEERSNRTFEIMRALRDEAPMRTARGHLIPAREAAYPTPVAVAYPASFSISRSAEERAGDVERARRRERDYSRALRRLHRYGLVAHNCATALFETINDSFEGSVAISQQRLGGHIKSRHSLSFIPFVSAQQVSDRYAVVSSETIPSYRRSRIRAMKERESPFRVALRESNTFTSTTYERSSADSFFIFFTDDAPYIRPILGVVNLTAAVGQSILGVFAAPIDRGDILLRGLRGAFVSLPELAFANIRKGSNDWIPREYRILEAIPERE